MEAFFILVFAGIFATLLVLTALLVATIARNKGREPANWVFICLLISPLLALLIVALMPPIKQAPRWRLGDARMNPSERKAR